MKERRKYQPTASEGRKQKRETERRLTRRSSSSHGSRSDDLAKRSEVDGYHVERLDESAVLHMFKKTFERCKLRDAFGELYGDEARRSVSQKAEREGRKKKTKKTSRLFGGVGGSRDLGNGNR